MLRDPSGVKISIRIPESLYQAIVEYAERYGISVGATIKLILRKFFGF